MIRSTSLMAAGTLLGLLVPVLQQDPKPATPQDKEKPAAAGQDHAAKEKPKTGVHKLFGSLAGEYEVACKFTGMGPEPMESKGKAKLTVIGDGRFLLEENEGTLMGKQFQGQRLYGWNAEAKQFEANWIYSLENGMMRLVGKTGADRKSVDFTGTVAGKDGEKMNFEVKAQRVAEDKLVFTLMHKSPDGKTVGTLEETYTKKK